MAFDRRNFPRAAALLPVAARELIAAPNRYVLQRNGYAVNAETPLELLTDYLTPNDLFFVRSHWIPHTPDAKLWKLTIDGEVDQPGTLSIADLKRSSNPSFRACSGDTARSVTRNGLVCVCATFSSTPASRYGKASPSVRLR